MSACAGQKPPAAILTVSWKIRELRLKETCSVQTKAHACSISCSCFQRHSQIDSAPCPPGLFFICIKQIHCVPNSTILFFLFYYSRGCKAKLNRISKITEKWAFVKGQLLDVRGKCDSSGCQKLQLQPIVTLLHSFVFIFVLLNNEEDTALQPSWNWIRSTLVAQCFIYYSKNAAEANGSVAATHICS